MIPRARSGSDHVENLQSAVWGLQPGQGDRDTSRADDEGEGAGATRTSPVAIRGQVEVRGTQQWSTYRREVWD